MIDLKNIFIRRKSSLHLLLKVYNVRDTHTLIFGDSVYSRISDRDSDKRNLAKMIQDEFNPLAVSLIHYSAYNIEIFYTVCKLLKYTKYKPKYIIIPINLRSFSPQWYLNPNWQYYDEIENINNFIRLNKTYKKYFPVYRSINSGLWNTFLHSRVKFHQSNLGSIQDFEEVKDNNVMAKHDRLRTIFIYHYLYYLNKNHEHLHLFNKLVDLTLDLRINLFFYFTPVNYNAGVKFVGKDFSKWLCKNTDFISTYLIRGNQKKIDNIRYNKNVYLMDFSQCLNETNFFNENNATEHLNENGRRYIAREIFKNFKMIQTIVRNNEKNVDKSSGS